MKQILGIGAVGDGIVRRALEEPRITRASQHARELPGDGATRAVHDLLGKHDRRRQDVSPRKNGRHEGGDRRPVRGLRPARVEPRRQVGTARQHDVVAGTVLVGAVRERAAQRPALASCREHRQVLADPHSGGPCGDRREVAPDVERPIRLGVETLVLGEATREKDEDDRAGRLTRRSCRGAHPGKFREAEHADRSGTHGIPPAQKPGQIPVGRQRFARHDAPPRTRAGCRVTGAVAATFWSQAPVPTGVYPARSATETRSSRRIGESLAPILDRSPTRRAHTRRHDRASPVSSSTPADRIAPVAAASEPFRSMPRHAGSTTRVV